MNLILNFSLKKKIEIKPEPLKNYINMQSSWSSSLRKAETTS